MEEEEEDDIYAPDDSTVHALATHINVANPLAHKNEDEEEGEEVEEEESDSVGTTLLLSLVDSLTMLCRISTSSLSVIQKQKPRM